MIANCSPKIIGSKLGSPFGLRPRSGLGSGSELLGFVRPRIGSGICSSLEADLARGSTWDSIHIGSVWLRQGERLSFVPGRLGSKVCSARISSALDRYLLFGWKLNSMNPDQLGLGLGSA